MGFGSEVLLHACSPDLVPTDNHLFFTKRVVLVLSNSFSEKVFRDLDDVK